MKKYQTRYKKRLNSVKELEAAERHAAFLANDRKLKRYAAEIDLAWRLRGIPTPAEYINPVPALVEAMKVADEAVWAAFVTIVAEEHGLEGVREEVIKNRELLAINRLNGCRPVDVVHTIAASRRHCAAHHTH